MVETACIIDFTLILLSELFILIEEVVLERRSFFMCFFKPYPFLFDSIFIKLIIDYLELKLFYQQF